MKREMERRRVGNRLSYYSPLLAPFPKLQKAVSWCGQQSRKERGTAVNRQEKKKPQSEAVSDISRKG